MRYKGINNNVHQSINNRKITSTLNPQQGIQFYRESQLYSISYYMVKKFHKFLHFVVTIMNTTYLNYAYMFQLVAHSISLWLESALRGSAFQVPHSQPLFLWLLVSVLLLNGQNTLMHFKIINYFTSGVY